ncbi:hypothetical protein [Mesorhizobium sp. INR15]|uniref:hypothetical protein n=1 Tax=Mesorhizobium sp. INR15 TaxID=2654248 RepID=UPI0018969F2E|nr:hypothetical protein [Mesorhizobium sp. INR15]QPC95809.1 hypothetical protein GA829_35245 [Mesorhizobium sp. INR15]
MESSIPAAAVVTPVESSSSAVSWGSIIAGGLAAASLTFILMLLGSGLGLTMVSPWSGSGASITTFAVSTAVWLVIVQWLSSGVGGYLTGRLRTKWVGVHTDETYFRDTAHGFLAWALATLLVVGVLGSALSAAMGTGAQAVSTVASGTAMGAAAGASGNDALSTGSSYLLDSLFRPADVSKVAASGVDAAAISQASHILLASAASGSMPDEDKTYLAKLIASRTGLSEADSKSRVDAVIAKVQDAKVKAKAAADTARKATATFALLSALSLVIGAFIASAAAALGGRQRDEDQDRYAIIAR